MSREPMGPDRSESQHRVRWQRIGRSALREAGRTNSSVALHHRSGHREGAGAEPIDVAGQQVSIELGRRDHRQMDLLRTQSCRWYPFFDQRSLSGMARRHPEGHDAFSARAQQVTRYASHRNLRRPNRVRQHQCQPSMAQDHSGDQWRGGCRGVGRRQQGQGQSAGDLRRRQAPIEESVPESGHPELAAQLDRHPVSGPKSQFRGHHQRRAGQLGREPDDQVRIGPGRGRFRHHHDGTGSAFPGPASTRRENRPVNCFSKFRCVG